MMGFVNGLAIVIFMAQLGMFTENSKDLYGQNKRKTESKEVVYNVANNEVKDLVSNTVLFSIKDNSVVNNQYSRRSIYYLRRSSF